MTERDHDHDQEIELDLDDETQLAIDQAVDAADEEPARLLDVARAELGVGDLAEGGELRPRTHRAGDEALLAAERELVGGGARDLRRASRELLGSVAELVLVIAREARAHAQGVL